MMALVTPPWPSRPVTDQRNVGYLWVPVDAGFLPAVGEVVRAACRVAGATVVPESDLVDVVAELVRTVLPSGEADRSWLLELETDDADLFVRVWLPLAGDAPVELGAPLEARLEEATGSYDVHREGTELLVILQLELLA